MDLKGAHARSRRDGSARVVYVGCRGLDWSQIKHQRMRSVCAQNSFSTRIFRKFSFPQAMRTLSKPATSG